MFQPRFTITSAITKALLAIEADRQRVAGLPLTARIPSSHAGSTNRATGTRMAQADGGMGGTPLG